MYNGLNYIMANQRNSTKRKSLKFSKFRQVLAIAFKLTIVPQLRFEESSLSWNRCKYALVPLGCKTTLY